MAANPLGTSENFKPIEGDKNPGHLKYSGTIYPMVALSSRAEHILDQPVKVDLNATKLRKQTRKPKA